jgi:phosphatidylinositol glycan class B
MATTKSPPTSVKARQEDPVEDVEDVHTLVYEQRRKDIWMLLFAFRIINALLVRTFFQPDEYFQSLEPAWQMAFGPGSGAWITWACTPVPSLSITY